MLCYVRRKCAAAHLDLLGPGGGPEQRLAVGADLAHNLADLGLKAHVQHAVGLVQHLRLDRGGCRPLGWLGWSSLREVGEQCLSSQACTVQATRPVCKHKHRTAAPMICPPCPRRPQRTHQVGHAAQVGGARLQEVNQAAGGGDHNLHAAAQVAVERGRSKAGDRAVSCSSPPAEMHAAASKAACAHDATTFAGVPRRLLLLPLCSLGLGALGRAAIHAGGLDAGGRAKALALVLDLQMAQKGRGREDDCEIFAKA